MLVKQVAHVLGNIHKQGYLYLDTKPQNVLVVDGYQKQVQLIDFDSLLSVHELKKPSELGCSDIRLSYDATGEEVYRNNGLRIVAKTILEDSSEYSSDMYVLLLAENTSGRTLTIDDTYDSLSVNGYMTDYSFYSAELADGESAALAIRLRESSLEENQITSVSDISEIEVGFEIRADRDTIDEPTVLIQFGS